MGKSCISCGADIDMPNLPEDEDEKCEDCQLLDGDDSDMDDMGGKAMIMGEDEDEM